MAHTVSASTQTLYSPKRTSTQKVGLVFAILGIPLLLAYGFGAVFLIPGILLWYYGRPKCPNCKVLLKMIVGKRDVNQEHGFGIVTREDLVRGRVGKYYQTSKVQRQERVPVVSTATTVDWLCSNCKQFVGTKTFYNKEEDFSPPQQQQTIVQREVLKIPCKYCGTLLDPVREKNCSHCGGIVHP